MTASKSQTTDPLLALREKEEAAALKIEDARKKNETTLAELEEKLAAELADRRHRKIQDGEKELQTEKKKMSELFDEESKKIMADIEELKKKAVPRRARAVSFIIEKFLAHIGA